MGKSIINLGTITGPMLLFGGVYSNLQALEELMRYAEMKGIPPVNCISTGDIVGYCAQPEETIQQFKKWGAKSILGNVEVQLRDGAEDCGCDFREGSRCDDFSQLWFPYAQSKLSEDSLEFLSSLPDHIQFTYAGQKVSILHGSYFNISEFIYKSTDWNVKAPNFEKLDSDVLIGGHCGLPFHHLNEHKHWLNPGVLGMPANDGEPHVWFMTLQDDKNLFSFKHHTLKYNYKLTSQLMQNGLTLPLRSLARSLNYAYNEIMS